MKEKNSKLTHFIIIALAAWVFIGWKWYIGRPHLIETSSLFFTLDIFIIFFISSTLFFVGLYKNSKLPNKSKRDKYIDISYIIMSFGLLYSLFDQRLGNLFFIGIVFFLYSLFFIPHNKKTNL